jgi:hypothetical protein
MKDEENKKKIRNIFIIIRLILFNITMKILLEDTEPDTENDITYFLFQNRSSLLEERILTE